MNKSKRVLVVYGGVSPEHEVAVITALQVMNALKGAGHSVLPLYISKEGGWFLGNNEYLKPEIYKDLINVERRGKRVVLSPDKNFGLLVKNWLGFGSAEFQPDVIFPVVHGHGGEDGTLQGLFEMSGIPYVGCGVTVSGLKIDKYLAKRVAASLGIEVLPDALIVKSEKPDLSKIKFPVMIKPVGLGSSIGLTLVKKKQQLTDALEVAFAYDQRVMVERALDDFSEVNVSILGNNPYKLSITEQPVSSGQILSFEDKYTGQGAKSKGMAGSKRYLPAKVPEKLIKKIEQEAIKLFRAIGGKGIARIDFMIDKKGKVYFNEINTMPGSLSFYMWEKVGVTFPKLVDELVTLALEDHNQKEALITTFESNILSNFAAQGIKGNKI